MRNVFSLSGVETFVPHFRVDSSLFKSLLLLKENLRNGLFSDLNFAVGNHNLGDFNSTKSRANVLGDLRAEFDQQMLKFAFLETADYKTLIDTTDRPIVVGRSARRSGTTKPISS